MLILGSTGSGKTTLAALFNNEELRAIKNRGLFKIELNPKIKTKILHNLTPKFLN